MQRKWAISDNFGLKKKKSRGPVILKTFQAKNARTSVVACVEKTNSLACCCSFYRRHVVFAPCVVVENRPAHELVIVCLLSVSGHSAWVPPQRCVFSFGLAVSRYQDISYKSYTVHHHMHARIMCHVSNYHTINDCHL